MPLTSPSRKVNDDGNHEWEGVCIEVTVRPGCYAMFSMSQQLAFLVNKETKYYVENPDRSHVLPVNELSMIVGYVAYLPSPPRMRVIVSKDHSRVLAIYFGEPQ